MSEVIKNGISTWVIILCCITALHLTAQRHHFEAFIDDVACHVDGLRFAEQLAVSPDGKHVYVLGRGDDMILIFERSIYDGSLIYLDGFQGISRPWDIAISPDGVSVYVVNDTGNSLATYTRNPSNGQLIARQVFEDGVDGVEGLKWPRRVIVSHDGKNVYATGWLDGTVVVFDRNTSNGHLSFREFFQDDVGGIDGLSRALGLALSPDGAHLYISGSMDDAVAIFNRDKNNGSLTYDSYIQHGVNGADMLRGANNIIIAANNVDVYIAARGDLSVALYKRNVSNGSLTFSNFVDNGFTFPERIALSPDERNLYVTSAQSESLSVYKRDTTTGDLSFDQFFQDNVNGVNGLEGASGLDISPDGRHVYATGSLDHAIAIFGREKPILSVSFEDQVRDCSGRKYHGWTPNILSESTSTCGTSLVIGQNDDDVIFLPGQSVHGMQDFTISVHAKITSQNNSNNLISMANATQSNELIIGYNEFLSQKGFHILIDDQFFLFPNTETLLDDLAWHDIAITRSGNEARLYFDGALRSGPITVNDKALNVADGGFVIGQDQDNVGGGFQGSQSWYGEIAKIDIHQYALCETEVTAFDCSPCTFEEISFDPIISLHFDGNLDDSSPNRNHACSADTPSFANSNCGQSIMMAGTNDALYLENKIMDGLGDFTLSANASINDIDKVHTIISGANYDEVNEFAFTYDPFEGIRLIINDRYYSFPSSATELSDLNDHHIVITRKDNEARLYVDGIPIGSPITVLNKVLKIANNGLVIGQSQGSVGGGFDGFYSWSGTIDQFRIFNFALAANDINLVDCETCPLEKVVDGDPIFDGNYYAEERIISSGQIKASDDVIFQAQTSFTLNESFSIEEGATLTTQFGTCPTYRVQGLLDQGWTPLELIAMGTTLPEFIGLTYAGGIIFYMDPSEDGSGMVITDTDLATTAAWGCMGTDISGAIGEAIGDGPANTAAIVAACPTAGTAARLCDDLILNGYDDWWLPSRREHLEVQRSNVFNNSVMIYWTSSQWNEDSALAGQFSQTSLFISAKDDVYGVRAARGF